MTRSALRSLCLLAAGLCALSTRPAFAVPVPFKNCGKPGDIVSIQQMDASVWPPMGTPVPLQARALYDPQTGNLIKLRVDLLYGPDWVFESDPLNIPVVGGFVTLPATLPLNLIAPALPIAVGPYITTEVFTSPNLGSQPVTVLSKATVGQAITSANTTLTLTFNGNPGFPVNGGPGTYTARVQVTEDGGQEVFCASFLLLNISFVLGQPSNVAIPTLSGPMLVVLAGLLASAGALALRSTRT